MGADTHIRVSEDVKERIDRRRRADESYSEALNRLLDDDTEARRKAFMEGFGMLEETNVPEKMREVHERGERKERARWRARAEGYPVTHRPGERDHDDGESGA